MRLYKRLFLLLILLGVLGISIAEAAPISVQHAAQLAATHLQQIRRVRSSAQEVRLLYTSSGRPIRGKQNTSDYYVFGAARGTGWVVVAGDDVVSPILAYSKDNVFPQVISPEFQAVLDSYAQLVQKTRENAANIYTAPVLAPDDVVEPLLAKIRWSQFAPYNWYSPMRWSPKDNVEKHAPTGCVATAVAQVMRYYAWPPKGHGKVKHLDKEIDFATEAPYNWKAMIGDYTAQAYTQEQGNAVARLMRDVGYASRMKFQVDESSTTPHYAFEALRRNFYYAKTLRHYITDEHSTVEWQRLLIDELKAGRPVPMGGMTIVNTAHEYVCDGYDGQGYFHLNWGWGGQSDGYFLLQSVGTGDGGTNGMLYNFAGSMIIGMQPLVNAPDAKELKEVYCDRNLKIELGRFPKSKQLLCIVEGMYNRAFSPIVGNYAVVLMQHDGQQVLQAHTSTPPILMKSNKRIFGEQTVALNLKDLPVGKYTLHAAIYETATKDYIVANRRWNEKRIFAVEVTEDALIVSEEEMKPKLTISVTPSEVRPRRIATFRLTVKNSGTQTYYCPLAAMLTSSEQTPEITSALALPFLSYMRIDPGTTEERIFTVQMPQSSVQYIHFFYDAQNLNLGTKRLPWHGNQTVSVPTAHHSSQKIVLSNNITSQYTVKRLAANFRLKKGEHFKMRYSVSVATGNPDVPLNLMVVFQQEKGGSVSVVDDFTLRPAVIISGETKEFALDKKIDLPAGVYQLLVYNNGLELISELGGNIEVLPNNGSTPPDNTIGVPSYPPLPTQTMATIHAPQIVKEGAGECFIYEIDTKERALAAGEQVEFGTLIGVAPKAASGYKIGRVEAEGADYLCEASYGDGAFVFEGKIYQVTGKDVRIKVSFLQDGTEPQPQKFMVHLPTGLVGGTCDVSIEGGTKLLSDTEVQEGKLLNIIATPTKLYKLAKLDVQGAEQQADGKYKVVSEVFITVRFEKEETPEPKPEPQPRKFMVHFPTGLVGGTCDVSIEGGTKLLSDTEVQEGKLLNIIATPTKLYKLAKLDVQGAEQQADGKYKVVSEVFITVRFEKEETPEPKPEPQPRKFMVHFPTGLVGGTCDVSIEGGTKLLSDTEVQEGKLLNIIATPTKLYKLAKLDVQGAEQQADGKYKVVSEVFITVRFEKEETPEPPTPNAIENVLLAGISIAPNPFSSLLKIKNDEAINARYELVNTNGMVMRKGSLQGTTTVLNTEELKAGIYLLHIFSDKTSKTLRVVKE